MIDHDVTPGHLAHCQIYGSSDLKLIIDYGIQPLCDSLLRPEDLNRPETSYPLWLFRCLECGNAQLDYIERFHNPKRGHSTICYMSPIEFERQAGLA